MSRVGAGVRAAFSKETGKGEGASGPPPHDILWRPIATFASARIHDNLHMGISVGATSNAEIKDCEIYNHYAYALVAGMDKGGAGINVECGGGSSATTVAGCRIHNNAMGIRVAGEVGSAAHVAAGFEAGNTFEANAKANVHVDAS